MRYEELEVSPPQGQGQHTPDAEGQVIKPPSLVHAYKKHSVGRMWQTFLCRLPPPTLPLHPETSSRFEVYLGSPRLSNSTSYHIPLEYSIKLFILKIHFLKGYGRDCS